MQSFLGLPVMHHAATTLLPEPENFVFPGTTYQVTMHYIARVKATDYLCSFAYGALQI